MSENCQAQNQSSTYNGNMAQEVDYFRAKVGCLDNRLTGLIGSVFDRWNLSWDVACWAYVPSSIGKDI